jgi:hypothetical protein
MFGALLLYLTALPTQDGRLLETLIVGVFLCKAATSLPAVSQKQGSGIRGMEITVIARQALLYGHIIAFALALATIIKEDVRLLRATRIDPASLHATAKLVKWLLVALWVTGVPMLVMNIRTDVSLLLGNPKLLAKLIVVGALTLNGIVLHRVAFPLITGKVRNPNRAATVAAVLGAVSTTSWLYASFVAVSRIVASYFSLYDFVLLYLLALAIAVLFAILVVRRRLVLSLKSSDELIKMPAAQRRRLSALLIEVENAMFERGDAQRRLRTNYLAQHARHHENFGTVRPAPPDRQRVTHAWPKKPSASALRPEGGSGPQRGRGLHFSE